MKLLKTLKSVLKVKIGYRKMWVRFDYRQKIALVLGSIVFINLLTPDLGSGSRDRFDPYNILGVSQSASSGQIKRAYKSLARQWHPDKSNDPTASDKFIEINKAYEILNNDDKRHQYDVFGTTGDEQQTQRSRGHTNSFHHQDPFFSGFGSFFHGSPSSASESYRVSARYFESHIRPDSVRKPALVYFYADFCFGCMSVEPIWQQIIAEYESKGVQIATININIDRRASLALGVTGAPAILIVANGRTHNLQGTLSTHSIGSFLKKLISHTVVEVTESNCQGFLEVTDKPVALLITQNKMAPLDYILPALYYARHYKFGHTTSDRRKLLCGQYPIDKPALLIFKEQHYATVLQYQNKVDAAEMRQVLEAHKFLTVPKLTAQFLFDELCPSLRDIGRQRFCLIFVDDRTPESPGVLATLQKFVTDSPAVLRDNIVIVYIDGRSQRQFLSALQQDAVPSASTKIFIMWRADNVKAFYSWLPRDCHFNTDYAVNQLIDYLLGVTAGNRRLINQVHLEQLIDEYAPYWISIYFYEFVDSVKNWYRDLDAEQVVNYVVIFGTVGFFILGLFLMFNISEPEPKNNRNRTRYSSSQDSPPQSDLENIMELTADSYPDMVSESGRGFITVIAFVNSRYKLRMLKCFKTQCQLYTSYKKLHWCYMNCDLYWEWYYDLLDKAVLAHEGNDEFLQTELDTSESMMPGYVVATVNMTKKSFFVFKAANVDDTLSFVGFDEGLESCFRGLDGWLDRLLQGQLRRFYVQSWPDLRDAH